jgi:hypothetical protein
MAVPIVGCPANGTSCVGVKIRTARCGPGPRWVDEGRLREVELPRDLLEKPLLEPLGIGITARGLPPKGVSVKTS